MSQSSLAKGKENLAKTAISRQRPGWSLQIALAFGIVGAIAYTCTPSLAQITPDATLGAENSIVTPNANVGGFPADLIQGGATRGTNLFHSFQEFNIGAGQRVYFANPAGIENILTRVTGNNLSNILGTLGVTGRADLFLLNPNGILFGPNARLDVGGSFFATTANAVQFGDRGFFSSTNPEAPGLLTVKPSAFFFNQLNAGTIVNQSVARNPVVPAFIEGLRVPNGENLVLLGGNISIDGGHLNVFGGRVEIGAVAGTGAVELNVDGSLNFPTDIQRADVSFTNGARVDVALRNGGEIAITGNKIELSNGSQLVAGIASGFGSIDSQAGDIFLNAEAIQIDQSTIFNAVFEGGTGNSGNIRITTGSLSLTKGAQLDASVFGRGNAGDITIDARDTVSVDGTTLTPFGELASVIFAEVLDGVQGNGGNIVINTGSLSATNGGAIIARTRGQGNAGNIIIRARDQVSFDGTSGAGSSSASSGVGIGAVGRGGNIEITAGSLSVTNGARLNASTSGQGSAGNVIINARDTVVFNRASALSFVGRSAEGTGGNIEITTGSLAITNDAELAAGTYGQGSSGSVIINASDRISLDRSGIYSDVEEGAIGNGGNIEITTDSLAITNGAVLTTDTSGRGDAGNIIINARARVSLDRSGIYSDVEKEAVGNGGNIEIITGSLTATNKSQLFADTSGQGNAGNIIIDARDRIFADAETLFVSGIEQGGVGRGGNITITTNSLLFTSGANLITRTRGRGDAGSIFITASDNVSFIGVAKDGNPSTGAFSNVRDNAAGRGGNIEITTGSLAVTDGAQLAANTSGQGDAGSVIVRASDWVLFAGSTPDLQFGSTAASTVEEGAVGTGGNVEITTRSLLVKDGAQLLSATEGQGDAGDVIIQASDWVVFDGESPNGRFATAAFSSVQSGAVGKGGNVEITTPSLSMLNGAQLVAATRGQGDAGDVMIRASDRILFDGVSEIREFSSGAFSSVEREAVGEGGNIDITTDSLFLTNGGQLGADTFGQGNAGNVIIQANEAVVLEGISKTGRVPSITTLTRGQGRGGTITVSTPLFRIADGAVVDARTAGSYQGGDITINADTFEAVNGGQIITTTQSDGRAGNIALNADRISLSGRNPVSKDLLDSISIATREGNGESGLFANTRPNSTGDGGTITVQTNTLSLADRAQIASSSQGTGDAGRVEITANEAVTLTNSDITTSAPQASGGAIAITTESLSLNRGRITAATGTSGAQGAADITLQGLDLLFMGNESLIEANALNQANGGNVAIDSTFIVATPPTGPEGSDITANAIEGNGGRVSINTQGLFGIEFRPELTPDNDITVSSTFGLSGEYILNSPDIDPSRGLYQLPTNLIDASQQIDRRCTPGGEARNSSFTITGRGGLPPSPNDVLQGETVVTSWVSLDAEVENNIPPVPTTPTSSVPRKLVEAQGWVINEKGEVVLTASAPRLTPTESGFFRLECPASQK